MKGTATLVAVAAAAFAQAGSFGTKGDPLTSSTGGASSIGFMAMVQMVIALVIVMVLLKVILPKVAGKLNKRLVTAVGSAIRIEESAAFAGGSLYIVNARNRTLLLSVATTGVACIADLTEPNAVPDPPTFQEMVETAQQEPNPQPAPQIQQAPEPVFAVVERPKPDLTAQQLRAAKALERLERLSV